MTRALAAAGVLLLLAAMPRAQPLPVAPAPERVAEGVLLYRLDDRSLLSPPGPVSVRALRLDPRAIRLEMGLADDRVPARETVQGIAGRRGALAAVNAGFFALTDGRPAALLKAAGRLLSGTTRARGAVGFGDRRGETRLLLDRVTAEAATSVYRTRLGSPARDWARAGSAVSGAGLLLLNGQELTDWADEKITGGFDTTRHPRTMIGDGNGAIWLITIDGRQPTVSLGMNFGEMQVLARRLGLRSALNLDGGGSTTMVVRGTIVNHPSDDAGPRKVSDAILVFPRKQP